MDEKGTIDGFITNSSSQTEFWDGRYKIPWDNPEFSRRMLREHLSQDHDKASRTYDRIDTQVRWIHDSILGGKICRILDLGCGPGFYAERLCAYGHEYVGIDFSPASIEYANSRNSNKDICEFIRADILQVEYGTGFDLVMLIFGELNAFPPGGSKSILRKAKKCLKPGGTLLLEVHTYESIEKMGKKPSSSFRSKVPGLFSDVPHVGLLENRWSDELRASRTYYWILEEGASESVRYTNTLQAYTKDEYREMLESNGFSASEFHSSLGEGETHPEGDLFVITAR